MPDTFQVNLGERSYQILIADDLSSELRACVSVLVDSGRKIAVVTDRTVSATCSAAFKAFGNAPVLAVPAGESSKALGELERILDFLAAQGIDRSGALFAVGGGVIGDLGGFAAAAYLRGIDYYQVPTTLLAMVDSSVGGKTGVNLKAGKNLVGAFHQPRGVFIATGLLGTLPSREFAAGMAEVIKTALLGDPALFADLERAPLTSADVRLARAIRLCCAAKARVVEADEQERDPSGGRALLNLGHTFGHAIEQVTGYRTYLHGEAVAIGLCAAAGLSSALGTIQASEASRVISTVAAHRLPTRLLAPLPLDGLMAAMARDKKARAGHLRFVVLLALGSAGVRSDVPAERVAEAWCAVGATPK